MDNPIVLTFRSGGAKAIHIRHRERCAVCDQLSDQCTEHHVFGRKIPIKIRACLDCHRSYHSEIDTCEPGASVLQMLRRVVEALEAIDTSTDHVHEIDTTQNQKRLGTVGHALLEAQQRKMSTAQKRLERAIESSLAGQPRPWKRPLWPTRKPADT